MSELALELKKFFLMWKKLLGIWLNPLHSCISEAMTLNAQFEFMASHMARMVVTVVTVGQVSRTPCQ